MQTLCLSHPVITATLMVGITIVTPDIATSEANNILKNELLLGNQENSLQHDIKSQMTV